MTLSRVNVPFGSNLIMIYNVCLQFVNKSRHFYILLKKLIYQNVSFKKDKICLDFFLVV